MTNRDATDEEVRESATRMLTKHAKLLQRLAVAGAELRRYRGWITLPVDERTPAHPESEVADVCRAEDAAAIIARLTEERDRETELRRRAETFAKMEREQGEQTESQIRGLLQQIRAIVADRSLGTTETYERLASILNAETTECTKLP